MSKVLQAAGRLIRSEKDRGVMVLMDKRFAQSEYSRCFPPDFEAELTGDAAGRVADFYGR